MRIKPLHIALTAIFSISLVALATGCKADLLISVDESSQQGTASLSLGINDFAINILQGFGGEFGMDDDEDLMQLFNETLLSENETALSEENGYRIERYSDGEYTGLTLTSSFDPNDPELRLLDHGSTTLLGLLGIEAEYTFRRNTDDNGWIVSITQPQIPDISEAVDDVDDSPFGFSIPDPNVTFRLQLPGEVISHNADHVIDGILVWNIDAFENDTVISAETRDSSQGPELGPILVTAVFAIIIIAIVASVLISRRRRATTQELDSTATG